MNSDQAERLIAALLSIEGALFGIGVAITLAAIVIAAAIVVI